METNAALTALAALAQESRLAVYRLLVQAGPEGLAANQIGTQLGIGASSLSFHLKELTHAQLIVPKQSGRFIIYSADIATTSELVAFLINNCCGGIPCTETSACAVQSC